MGKIFTLDDVTINQIAAGEVIDRPASVIKELVENAIDAGSSHIRIELDDGGKKRISIIDNGSGIEKEDLPLALTRHATSKLKTIHDLKHHLSFGFRGEALASISHVSFMEVKSKSEKEPTAYQLRSDQGRLTTIDPCSRESGTTITVENIFHGIPVRQKFLKSGSTEFSHCYDMVVQFSFLYPKVNFVLIHNDKEVLNTSGVSDLKKLVALIWGKSALPHLVEIHEEIGPMKFKGVIGAPTLSFPNRSRQVFALNGRPIKSAVIQKAVSQAYLDILPHRRFPLLVLDIEMEPELVDINVHPQKQDVKFLNSGFLYSALPKAIHLALQTTGKKPALFQESFATSTPISQITGHVSNFSGPNFAYPHSQYEKQQNIFSQHATETEPETNNLYTLWEPIQETDFKYLHVFDTYIVVQSQKGLFILDQHAVHERILYEKIKVQHENKEKTQQPLLISEIIPVTPEQFMLFEDHIKTFSELGFEIESFGENQVVVSAIPTQLSKTNCKELVLNFLDELKEIPTQEKDLILEQKETLQMKACKAAIKAGDPLAPEEVRALIQDLLNAPSKFTCPHGRPLFINLTKADLEKLFLRR